MTNIPFPFPFKRQFSGPLDKDQVFQTTAEMTAYLSSPLRYAGQVVTCAEQPGKIFVLNATRTAFYDYSSELADSSDPAKGAALVGFLQSGSGAVGRTAQDKMRETVSVKDFGVASDGTDQTTKLQSAIDATPIGGTLYIDVPGVIVIDTLASNYIESDLGSNQLFGGLRVNKPMRIVGNKNTELKIKNFSSAWASQTNGDSVCAVLITSSNVHIDGLNIDCNGANHYEESGVYKYWENGPTLKRPPCGITISVERIQANVENVLIENCRIRDPLAGISFVGNAVDASRADFMDGSLSTGVVKNCVSRNNRVDNSRGNGVLFNLGVDRCVSIDDVFINCMYHAIRIYSRAVRCYGVRAKSFVDADQIISRYNTTDLGYWRTDNTGDATHFKMERSGFSIGSGYSYDAYGYSVSGCGFEQCLSVFNQPTSGLETYFSTSSLYFSSYSILTLNNNTLISNRSYGHSRGISVYKVAGDAPANADGVVIKGNVIVRSFTNDIHVQGAQEVYFGGNYIHISPSLTGSSVYVRDADNTVFDGNRVEGSPLSGTYIYYIEGTCGGVRFCNNTFSNNIAKIRRYVQVAGSTPYLAYPGRVTYPLASDALIGAASYSNGWVAAYGTPGEGQENAIRILPDGSVHISLRLSAATATAVTVATLVSGLRPADTVGFSAVDIATGKTHWGRILTDGQIQINNYAASNVEIWADVVYNIL